MLKVPQVFVVLLLVWMAGGCSLVRLAVMEHSARHVPLAPDTQRDFVNANGVVYPSYHLDLSSAAPVPTVAAWYEDYFSRQGWRVTGRSESAGEIALYLGKGIWIGTMPLGIAEKMVVHARPVVVDAQGRKPTMQDGREAQTDIWMDYEADATWDMPVHAVGDWLWHNQWPQPWRDFGIGLAYELGTLF